MSFDKIETAIILAAGRSQRFGERNKLLAPWRGSALASHAIAAAAASKLRHIILVTGEDRDAVAALAPSNDQRFQRAHNDAFANGLSSSLQTGLCTAPDGPVMILLADMPMITAELTDNICDAWRASAYALAPTFEGQMGNPVILGPTARADAMTLDGDRGARALFEGRADVILHPVSDEAILRDFDSSADFSD